MAMGARERRDAVRWDTWVDGGRAVDGETARRRREVEELLAEEEEEKAEDTVR